MHKIIKALKVWALKSFVCSHIWQLMLARLPHNMVARSQRQTSREREREKAAIIYILISEITQHYLSHILLVQAFQQKSTRIQTEGPSSPTEDREWHVTE